MWHHLPLSIHFCHQLRGVGLSERGDLHAVPQNGILSRRSDVGPQAGKILMKPMELIPRAFHAGIDPDPVMCQTVDTASTNNCGWASCGEWCLTKTSGFCPQIHATVRRNGTDIVFENCTKFGSISCPQVRRKFYLKRMD
ncbi:uncharacterized protein LOC108626557 isoform X1 [Ceratina calcarata]|uniref:Uncharacterized protein LOC108626557 isoform X1 n=1 Tax=Ceratina calcarata TaxID=156304 RepID=A0AAJ7S4E7_9HYME|nr:uncharacterized protein LOC108626557 isoform X1 [Ceratina calcarata]